MTLAFNVRGAARPPVVAGPPAGQPVGLQRRRPIAAAGTGKLPAGGAARPSGGPRAGKPSTWSSTRNWYQTEQSQLRILALEPRPGRDRHPQSAGLPVEVDLQFDLRAYDERTVRVFQGDGRPLGGTGRPGQPSRCRICVGSSPGDNPWRFETDKPSDLAQQATPLRPVAFNLRNFVIRAVRKIEPDPVHRRRPALTGPRAPDNAIAQISAIVRLVRLDRAFCTQFQRSEELPAKADPSPFQSCAPLYP